MSNRSKTGTVDATLVGELMQFYEDENVVKLLFSGDWKDRE